MEWMYPERWWLVVIVILSAVFLFMALKWRRQALAQWSHEHLLKVLASEVLGSRRFWKRVMLVFAILAMVLALVGPQWGTQWQEVHQRGADIIVALDVSKSMLAEDVKPNRLERAKLAVRDLVAQLEGDRIGLVIFAGSAFLQCPLTVDYSAFTLNLDAVNADLIPMGGTRLEQAITVAQEGFQKGSEGSQVLILITDGEDHEGQALQAADEAAKAGIRVYAIGIGTPEGELIPVPDARGVTSFLKNRQGQVVKSRLDEASLQKIVLKTQGAYIRATANNFGLDQIYQQYIEPLDDVEFEASLKKQHILRYQWPLCVAFILLLVEPMIADRRMRKEVV